MAVPLAVSMGDPAGIGPEIAAKAWAARDDERLSPFAMIGDPAALRAVWGGPVEVVASLSDAAAVFARALPVLAVGEAGPVQPGAPTEAGARAALLALARATDLVLDGAARALVTGPVAKAQLYAIGFDAPGQTEYVADRCGMARADAVMMLAGPTLRVVPITGHVPLADVPRLLTRGLIVAKGRATAAGLARDFGIAAPRLAFAGLNPHAGESGTIGGEEIAAMVPAIATLRDEGIDAHGPFAADTLFHPRARARWDAILCPYHDQALIPLKTIHFDEGVNITLGLPIVRTSPDHGTAFGIAGQNAADPGAMIAAIRMSDEAAARRAA
ncbi:4-hydroxythreonine-4-phosphate dehydrogenase PdxA [Sphingomonas sp.]|uniref:4-hydroxythreonine-4-phosphate dehydrogenase PdxA n=1 Tax=Sphingomonas sp. TaxID=28214 RepID=UPI003B00D569